MSTTTPTHPEPAATRMLRIKQVAERTGLARSTIYGLIGRHHFPAPVKVTDKASRWPESAIDAWLEGRTTHTAQAAPQRAADIGAPKGARHAVL